MLYPAWVSTLRRKQRADCSPRIFLRGLHTPAAGPQPTERQGLHPSSPKGPLISDFFFILHIPHHYPSIITSILFPQFLCFFSLWLHVQKCGPGHLKLQRCKESTWKMNEQIKPKPTCSDAHSVYFATHQQTSLNEQINNAFQFICSQIQQIFLFK